MKLLSAFSVLFRGIVLAPPYTTVAALVGYMLPTYWPHGTADPGPRNAVRMYVWRL